MDYIDPCADLSACHGSILFFLEYDLAQGCPLALVCWHACLAAGRAFTCRPHRELRCCSCCYCLLYHPMPVLRCGGFPADTAAVHPCREAYAVCFIGGLSGLLLTALQLVGANLACSAHRTLLEQHVCHLLHRYAWPLLVLGLSGQSTHKFNFNASHAKLHGLGPSACIRGAVSHDCHFSSFSLLTSASSSS
jgi:hypothetical protein